MTYPRSPPGRDATLSESHYHPEPPASSFVKEVQDTHLSAAVGIYEVILGKCTVSCKPQPKGQHQCESCRGLLPFGAQCILAVGAMKESYFECLFSWVLSKMYLLPPANKCKAGFSRGSAQSKSLPVE